MISWSSLSRAAGMLAVLVPLCIQVPAPAHAESPVFDKERGVMTMAPLLERTTGAVVNVSVVTRLPVYDNPLLRDPFFRRFFGIPEEMPERKAISAGSGVVVDADKGHVVTNHHVVRNADRITVTTKDGRKLGATLIGGDQATDVALLDVKPDGLTEIVLGDSDTLKVGDVVIAVGNPFGLGQTVTSGIVSALGRSGLSAGKYEDFIQTDASINPGNSGGALMNTKGELMGINTAIIAPGGGNVGIGFAIPSNMVKAVMRQLLAHGTVKRGRIGVSIQTITPDIASALGLPIEKGAVVTMVEPGSPAEVAGLTPGDAVVSVDGKPVVDAGDLRNEVGLRERGQVIELTYYRKSTRRVAEVKIGAAP